MRKYQCINYMGMKGVVLNVIDNRFVWCEFVDGNYAFLHRSEVRTDAT